MQTGTVKWFNTTKGYGYIQPDQEGAKDVIFGITFVPKTMREFIKREALEAALADMREGQRVSFELETKDGRSLFAFNLKKISPAFDPNASQSTSVGAGSGSGGEDSPRSHRISHPRK